MIMPLSHKNNMVNVCCTDFKSAINLIANVIVIFKLCSILKVNAPKFNVGVEVEVEA